MEIAFLPGNSIRIKGKQATLIVDPADTKGKVTGDAALLLGDSHTQHVFREDVGVVFQGAGEYEVKGVKITGFKAEGETMYTISVDGLSVFVGKVTSSIKAKDKLHEHDLAVLFADEVLPQATMGLINPNVILFYGEKAGENTKAFGKEDVSPVNKYVTTKDKLPQEKEFIVFG
jgi:hypothetical protein